MGLKLAQALRLPITPSPSSVAFVGAGGKTTAMFQVARELDPPVIVTATAHLGAWQLGFADRHIVLQHPVIGTQMELGSAVTLFTGPALQDKRTAPLSQDALLWLREISTRRGIPLLVEADGSRQRPLKAPIDHEPPIPDFIDTVVVSAGISSIGKPLTGENVHRPEAFSTLSGLSPGANISAEAITAALTHPQGGRKNIPTGARGVALLNQADTSELRSRAQRMVPSLLAGFDAVVIACLMEKSVYAVHEPAAIIILAAGGSSRYGAPKQLLDWRGQPFVRAVAKTALEAGATQAIVVTGAQAERVEAAVQDLPLAIVRNEAWESGQGSSICAGVQALSAETGSAIFLLADQPQITVSVIRSLMEIHAAGLFPVVAPLVLNERRANPVLFDKVTFPDLLNLRGDVGGRAIFSKFPVEFMPWHDDRLLLDVDEPEDYRRLLDDDTL